jgi:hypothetical protein
LRGRPTEVHEHRHVSEIVAKLRAITPALVIEGTVDQSPDHDGGKPLPE